MKKCGSKKFVLGITILFILNLVFGFFVQGGFSKFNMISDCNIQDYTIDWIQEFSPIPMNASADYLKAIAKDDEGNVYLTGDSYLSNGKIVIVTFKVSNNGENRWMSKYNSRYGKIARAKKIGVDNEGNVYICGETIGNDRSYDFLIVKYNNLGLQVWERYFNGPTNNYDESVDMKIDMKGNVYVTGISYLNDSNINIATVKFDKFGTLQYATIFDGPDQMVDYPIGLVLDSLGCAYVTGYSEDLNTGYDIITIKYDTSGNEIWSNRYNTNLNTNDFAKCIAIDNLQQYIYISGVSEQNDSNKAVILKLNQNGDIVWVTNYNREEHSDLDVIDMEIDNSNNLIINCRSSNNSNQCSFVTIKYNQYGELIWVDKFNQSEINVDEPVTIVIDKLNNVYLTGTSLSLNGNADVVTLMYDSMGNRKWIATFDGKENGIDEPIGMVINNYNELFIAGYSRSNISYEDFLIIKYDSIGNLKWSITRDISGMGVGFIDDIIADKYGNIYGVGKQLNLDSSYSCIVFKYNGNGTLQWLKDENLGKVEKHQKVSLALDSASNLYLLCTVWDDITKYDFLLVKYDQDGKIKWIKKYDGGESLDDVAVDISIDRYQNIYVTGYTKTTSRSFEYVTIKYDYNGNVLWQKIFGSSNNKDDIPIDMCIDNFGGIYITGESYQSDSYSIIRTVNYDLNGELKWIVNFGSYGKNSPVKIINDGKGYVYVIGYAFNDQNGFDYITIKYSILNGTTIWQRYYDGNSNGNDLPSDIAIGENGDVYVTGKSLGEGSMYDIVTIKYNSLGAEQWLRRYNGVANRDDIPRSMCLGQDDNLFITGLSHINFPQTITLIYDKFGNEGNKLIYSDNKSTSIDPVKLLLDPRDNIILGVNEYFFEWSKFSIIKYKKSISTKVVENENENNFNLKFFPNPFNNKININFSLKEDSDVSVCIYDIRGRLIKNLLYGHENIGDYTIFWNGKNEFDELVSNGIYILQFRAGSFISYEKILMIK